MERLPFRRPTEHYDARLLGLDEQLCELLKLRMDISNGNPGFPSDEQIAKWASAYGLYEDYLKKVFGTLITLEHFRPRVEPSGFRKQIPISQSVEVDECFYTVATIRQYTNASVVVLHVDRNATVDKPDGRPEYSHFELFAGVPYDCWNHGGSGSREHFSYKFVVSPALPDDLSGIELVFSEYKRPFRVEPTGVEIVIRPGG
jgi:hypothetical protein